MDFQIEPIFQTSLIENHGQTVRNTSWKSSQVYEFLSLEATIIPKRQAGRTVPKSVPFMKASLKRLPARFYRSDNGREPVREWLKALDPEDRKVIGEDIKDVEFSWPDFPHSVLRGTGMYGALARLH